MPEVDATDARLLLALAEDPRASVMALSQRLGLARNTVQARLARLESNDVLAPLDRRVRPEALGYRLGAYMTVTVVQRSLAEVSDALADIPEVLEVTGLSGVVDLLVEVVARDADDLWRITEQVLAIPGVQRTDTALALRRFVQHRRRPAARRADRRRRYGRPDSDRGLPWRVGGLTVDQRGATGPARGPWHVDDLAALGDLDTARGREPARSGPGGRHELPPPLGVDGASGLRRADRDAGAPLRRAACRWCAPGGYRRRPSQRG